MSQTRSKIALATLIALVATGCSGQSEGDAGGGKRPSTVKIAMLADLTGGASFCGKAARTGAETAVKKINNDGLAGPGTKLALTVKDTATNPRQAASAMSRIAGDDAVAVTFGCASQVALAVAPVAQQSKIPFVAMQSGAPGVLEAGDYVFRSTAPQSSYQKLVVDKLVPRGVKSAAIVYQSDNATLVTMGEKIYPSLLANAGISVIAREKFQGAGFDFAALASRVAGRSPDAVIMLGQGTPNVTVITQLRQAGFRGTVVGSQSFEGGVLAPLGGLADGALWASDFNTAGKSPSTRAFVDYYRSVNRAEPSTFAAQAWDSMMLLAAGVKAAPKVDRAGVRTGLQTAAGAGVEGAVGRIRFEGRDARVPGLVITWRNGREQLADAANGS
ncbi:ABC transporter substrate-binding protein [Actinomadura rugatobispora]|uniref:ABC transporter substrate-binding protein n=1 Tax=Actinomadura rugatobispora TaxID=1994 RepID=A0ABW1A3A6_9ACTN